MEYKVGDIVEFKNPFGVTEYGLIKDTVGFDADGTCTRFSVAYGSDKLTLLHIDKISRRCNKYCVGQRVWYAPCASECVITDISFADYNIWSIRSVIHYSIRNLANNEWIASEDQLTLRPANYGIGQNDISKVIFNDPATIIIWKDGTKTVVKAAPGETYNKWAGMALCISKKLYGDRFHRIFKEYCGNEEPVELTEREKKTDF